MNKSTLAAAITLALGGASLSAQAALTTGSVLQFAAGNVGNFGSPAGAGASWFSMQVSPTVTVHTGLSAGTDGGIKIGVSQPLPSGVHSHPGLPYGGTYTTDIGVIDTGWGFFSNTGMHFTTTPISVVTDSGTTKTLDFSGWNITWNSIPSIKMGGGKEVVSSFSTKTNVTYYTTYDWGTGLATIACSTSSCSNSSSFTLDYSATERKYEYSGYGAVPYALHLTGTVSSVPVPAAAWLFGSGLAGLIGMAGRRKLNK